MIKNKKLKKFSVYVLTLIISVCMTLLLCGCGDEEKSSGNSTANFPDKSDSSMLDEKITHYTDDEEKSDGNFTATSPDNSDSAMLDEKLTYYADIDIKDYGTVTFKFEQSSAPITCANFVDLANSGFYNGLTFHRIIEDFMMQGGDPKGNGTGGSENTILGEFSANGSTNNLSHTRGAVSMARSSDYNSASSQFFIVHKDSTFLDGQYAVFGYVTDGMDIVDKICESAKPTDNNGTISSKEQPVINTISIRTE